MRERKRERESTKKKAFMPCWFRHEQVSLLIPCSIAHYTLQLLRSSTRLVEIKQWWPVTASVSAALPMVCRTPPSHGSGTTPSSALKVGRNSISPRQRSMAGYEKTSTKLSPACCQSSVLLKVTLGCTSAVLRIAVAQTMWYSCPLTSPWPLHLRRTSVTRIHVKTVACARVGL